MGDRYIKPADWELGSYCKKRPHVHGFTFYCSLLLYINLLDPCIHGSCKLHLRLLITAQLSMKWWNIISASRGAGQRETTTKEARCWTESETGVN